MGKEEVISKGQIAPDFKRKLATLSDRKKAIEKGRQLLAKAYIEFAQDLAALWEEAKALDKRGKTKLHTEQVQQLGSLDGTTLDKSTISRWGLIAKQSDRLLPLHDSLPPSRDALYAVAQAVDDKINLAPLIKRNVLSPESTVSACKALRGKTTGGKKQPKGRVSKQAPVGQKSITSFKPIALRIDADSLPHGVQRLLNDGGALLRIKAEVDPDTNQFHIFADGFGVP